MMGGSWRPERSHEERLARAVQSMIPGTMQGRIAQASPIDRNNRARYPTDPDEVAEQESAVMLFHQDEFVVTDPALLDFWLTYEPIENSEHLYWHPGGGAGIYQQASEWTRTEAQRVNILDDAALVQAGDVFVVEYAYRQGPPKGPIDSFMVGSLGYSQLYYDVSLEKWPDGTQNGDLFVIGALHQSGGSFDVSDSRLRLITTLSHGQGTVFSVWGGYVTDVATAPGIIVRGTGGMVSISNSTNCIVVTTFRSGDTALSFDPTALTVTPPENSSDGLMRGLGAKEVSGGICLYVARGGIGGGYDRNWGKSAPWTRVGTSDGSYAVVDVGHTKVNPVPDAATPNNDPDDLWAAVVLGLAQA